MDVGAGEGVPPAPDTPYGPFQSVTSVHLGFRLTDPPKKCPLHTPQTKFSSSFESPGGVPTAPDTPYGPSQSVTSVHLGFRLTDPPNYFAGDPHMHKLKNTRPSACNTVVKDGGEFLSAYAAVPRPCWQLPSVCNTFVESGNTYVIRM